MEGGKVISNHHGNNDELHIPVIPEILWMHALSGWYQTCP